MTPRAAPESSVISGVLRLMSGPTQPRARGVQSAGQDLTLDWCRAPAGRARIRNLYKPEPLITGIAPPPPVPSASEADRLTVRRQEPGSRYTDMAPQRNTRGGARWNWPASSGRGTGRAGRRSIRLGPGWTWWNGWNGAGNGSADALDDGRVGHAAALAHGLQAVSNTAGGHVVDQRGHQPGTGRAERVADGDGSAARVEPGRVGAGLGMQSSRAPATASVDGNQFTNSD
jgi:hypothetical protein